MAAKIRASAWSASSSPAATSPMTRPSLISSVRWAMPSTSSSSEEISTTAAAAVGEVDDRLVDGGAWRRCRRRGSARRARCTAARSSVHLREQRLLLVAAGVACAARRRGRAARRASWSITERTRRAFRAVAHGTVAAEPSAGAASVDVLADVWVMTRPSVARSSGSITTPRRIAPCGRSRGRTAPSSSSSPDVDRVGADDHARRARCARCRRGRRGPRSRRRAPGGRRPCGTSPAQRLALRARRGRRRRPAGRPGSSTSSWRPSMPSTSESLVSAAAGAVRAMRPSRMIVTVSATASTSSRKWLTYTSVRPVRAQVAHQLLQALRLVPRQRRGRLVEHDQAGVAGEGAHDLDLLLVGEAQRRHRHVAGQAEADALVELAVAVEHRAAQHAERRTLDAEEHVLGDRAAPARATAPAGSWRCRRPARAGGFHRPTSWPSTRSTAAVGDVDAADDLAERRLAGAVLADEGVDGAGLDLDRHGVERLRRAEPLGDADDRDLRRPGRSRRLTVRDHPAAGCSVPRNRDVVTRFGPSRGRPRALASRAVARGARQLVSRPIRPASPGWRRGPPPSRRGHPEG